MTSWWTSGPLPGASPLSPSFPQHHSCGAAGFDEDVKGAKAEELSGRRQGPEGQSALPGWRAQGCNTAGGRQVRWGGLLRLRAVAPSLVAGPWNEEKRIQFFGGQDRQEQGVHGCLGRQVGIPPRGLG